MEKTTKPPLQFCPFLTRWMLTALITTALLALLPAGATAQTVHVDASAAPGGDGSAGSPFQTIQEGLAALPATGGTVLIEPGTYRGPVVVDGENVILQGNTAPMYDAEGYLAGFQDEVVIGIDHPAQEGDPLPNNPVDLVALRGSGNELHNMVIDSRGVPLNASIAAFSAVAEDDEFYSNVVFSHIIVRGPVEIGGFSAKADVLFDWITSVDPGFVGIWGGANGNVEISHAHIARKSAGVVFCSLDEQPKADNGPSLLTALLRDSKIRNGNVFEGFFPDGSGLLVLGRKNAVNQAESSTLLVEANGNTFQGNRVGVQILASHGPNGFSIEPTLIGFDFHDNSYIGNHLLDVFVDFRAPAWAGNYFAANTSVLVEDADGAFPVPAEVDLGAAENGNEYVLNP